MATTLGQIIKNLRKGRGFTQEELAERLGVTYRYRNLIISHT